MTQPTAKPKVDFFVIGAARSGTTSLYRALSQHPDVFQNPIKEPRFFGANWDKGWEWYASVFAGATPAMLCGDYSPSYSNAVDVNGAAKRIAEHYPQARIVYMVRNPIECAISNWRMTAETKNEICSFRESLSNDWKSGVFYRALFFRQLQFYRSHFPDAQILVVPLEVVRKDGRDLLARIQRHIGIPEERVYDIPFPRANASEHKVNRPPTPDIPLRDRQYFIDLIRADATALLRHIDQPPSLWRLTTDAPAWTFGADERLANPPPRARFSRFPTDTVTNIWSAIARKAGR